MASTLEAESRERMSVMCPTKEKSRSDCAELAEIQSTRQAIPQPNPTHEKVEKSQPNPTDPMGQLNPLPSLWHISG